MSSYMKLEAVLFGQAVVEGIFLVLIYKILKWIRENLKFPYAAVAASDIIYWITMGTVLCGNIYRHNQGVLRGYMLIGLLCGALFVKFSLNLAKRLLFRIKRCKISSYKLTEDCSDVDQNRIPCLRRGKRIEKVKKKKK